MAAEDELALPEVPEAKPEDPEDVSWALSTAEAMWARGDHLEGIKWVRKAAEAASDAENDERHLELAKAASELASLIARRSRSEVPGGGGYAGGAPSEVPAQPTSGSQPSSQPSTARSAAPPPPPHPVSSTARPPPVPTKSAPHTPRSMPPGAPLPARASTPPKAPQVPQAPRSAPRPLATGDARQGPLAGRGILSNRTAPEAFGKTPKARRRSRENLDAEAKAAGVLDTAPQTAVDGATAERALRNDVGEITAVASSGSIPAAESSAGTRAKRRSRPDPEPTVVGRIEDLVQAEREKSAVEWDASPTANLTGDDMDQINVGDRKTTAFAIPAAKPASIAPPPPRASIAAVHDPGIQTSQAVRVVVWRDGTGVHIAPAGTVVSSITIDAVLVVLEPSADLTAWLSQRER
ncbi:MAG: Translation initiation factor 2 [Labilithrix sp.]|nr:Translation initiation factor 2 [Labilithrix sp.]